MRAFLRDILEITPAAGCGWGSFGEPTKHGHPRYPLYVRGDAVLQPFDTGEYLRTSF